jgi:DNA polymerase III sliding clamp (beta) subunit (PCNA family)
MKTNILAFLNAARSKDETRYFMIEAYFDAEAKRLAATDGQRLHFRDLSDGEIAAYGLDASGFVALDEKRNIITYVKLDGQFPNYMRVIPDYAPNMDDDKAPSLDTRDFDRSAPQFLVRESIVFNLAYLRDLKKGSEKWRCAFDPHDKKRRAVHFIAESNSALHAVIMPIRQD